MNEDRKAVIINELVYWKQNKLLPDQYCDYLLTLYMQGEEIENSTSERPAEVNIKKIIFLFVATSLIPVLFFMVLYSKVTFTVQLIILTVSLVFSYCLKRKFSRDIKAVSSYAEISWLILLLVSLLFFLKWVGLNFVLMLGTGIIYFIIIGMMGWKSKKLYLIYTFAVGIIFTSLIIFL